MPQSKLFTAVSGALNLLVLVCMGLLALFSREVFFRTAVAHAAKFKLLKESDVPGTHENALD